MKKKELDKLISKALLGTYTLTLTPSYMVHAEQIESIDTSISIATDASNTDYTEEPQDSSNSTELENDSATENNKEITSNIDVSPTDNSKDDITTESLNEGTKKDIKNDNSTKDEKAMNASDFIVQIPDPNFKDCLLNILGKPTGSDIYKSELATIETIHQPNKGITSLEGIEHCTLVYSLDLRGNNITDLTPISNLQRVNYLDLDDTNVSNLKPIENLTNIIMLSIASTKVTDINCLKNLKKIQRLYIFDNNISDISVISNFPDLTRLDASKMSVASFPKELVDLKKLVYVDLADNKIQGTLPSNIFDLPNLETLYLQNNLIYGTIPTSIPISNVLKILNLGKNALTGSIPREFSRFKNLTHLNLRENSLSGSIPKELGELESIIDLYLNNNKLTGSIPKELCNLEKVQNLVLSYNELTGEIPNEISDLISLKNLELQVNKLSGGIPSTIGKLSNLDCLVLRSNNLEGVIPSEIGNLSKLTQLYLRSNNFTGTFPSSISQLPLLNHLEIQENQLISLGEDFPDKFKKEPLIKGNFLEGMPNQKQLVLKNNETINTKLGEQITLTDLESKVEVDWNGVREPLNSNYKIEAKLDENFIDSNLYTIATGSTSIPLKIVGQDDSNTFTTTSNSIVVNIENNEIVEDNWLNREVAKQVFGDENKFADLTNADYLKVQEIRLSEKPINSTIPSEIGKLKNLKHLSMYNSGIHGTLPDELWTLTNLEHLGLSTNNLTGEISSKISNLKNLTFLDLNKNNFDGNFPATITYLTKLTTLRIAENNLVGSLPSGIYKFTALEEINLSKNNLSGIIPSSIGQLTNLRILNLGYNTLTGAIPKSICQLYELERLVLDKNNLTGSIPEDLGNLRNLKTIGLWKNSFTGSIPQSIGMLGNLESLSLSDNKFSGELPNGICNLSKLKFLDLNQNNFSGEIPSNIGNLTSLTTFRIKDNNLAGKVPNSFDNLTNITNLDLRNNQIIGLSDNFPSKFKTDDILQGNLLEGLQNQKQLVFKNNSPIETTVGTKVTTMSPNSSVEVIWGTAKEPLSDKYTVEYLLDSYYIDSSIIAAGVGSTTMSAKITSASDSNTFAKTNNPITVNIKNNVVVEDNWLNREVARQVGKDFKDLTDKDYETVKYIEIIYSGVSGVIPKEIGKLKNLTHLILEGNELTGTIPEELYTLTNLIDLNLKDNKLNGTISKNIKNLSKLERLFLNINNFEGTIPDEIGSLKNLEWLALSHANFEGEFPKSILNLTNLSELYLSNNNFYGAIPSEISNLKRLTRLSLSNNQFIIIPDNFPSKFKTEDTLKGNLIEGIPNQKQLVLKNSETINTKLGQKLTLSNLESKVEVDWNGVVEPLNKNYKITYKLDENFIDSKLYTIDTGVTGISLSIVGCDDSNTFTTTSTPLEVTIANNKIVEDNWLNREVARQVGKDLKDLTDNDYAKITHIHLKNASLTGEIPKEIGKLINLESLNLEENSLTGSIPKEIGNLKNLKYIYLWVNNLSGSLPKELFTLTELEGISLGRNQFTGSIPKEIGNLTNLIEFSVYGNNLTGAIPKEISNIKKLNTLWIGINNISGSIPKEIGSMTSLTSIWMDNMQLEGNIPEELGNLVNLTELHLNDNNLTGSVPSSIGNISSLNIVNLYNNQIIDIPADYPSRLIVSNSLKGNLIEGMPNQKQLVLKNSETINTKLGQRLTLSKLESKVEVEWNGVREPLNSAYNVEYKLDENFIDSKLYTIDTGITSIPLSIVGSNETNTFTTTSTPIEVNIANNKVIEDNWLNREVARQVGKDFKDLTTADYRKITHINLSNNPINDYIPKDIGKLENLIHFNLNNTGLIGSIPKEIGQLKNLQTIELWDNNLDGQIPEELYSLTKLTGISIGRNNLTGKISTKVGNLTNLQHFSVYGNQLTGTIPKEISKIPNLKKLWIGVNNISGSIPKEIGSMTSLTSIWMDDMLLEGVIPKEFGNLVNLTELHLNDNNLTGTIPSSISDITSLTTFNLFNNQIIGIPENYPTRLKTVDSLKGNLIEGMANQKQLVLKNSETINTKLGSKITLSNLESKVEVDWNGVIEPLNSAYKIEYKLDENFIDSKLYTIDTGVTSIPLSIIGSDETNPFTTTSTPIEVTIANNKVVEDNWLNREVARQVGKDFKDLTTKDYEYIKEINIQHSDINDVIPKDIGKLKNLEILVLAYTNLQGDIPEEIYTLKNLYNLNIPYSNLSGSISENIKNLTNLQYLNIVGNNISGTLPKGIGSLKLLEEIHMQENQISGPIPNELYNAKNLTLISLGANNITGVISDKISQLQNLEFISIRDNKLSGSIPASLFELPNLDTVLLYGNNLAGDILDNNSNIQNLTRFDVKNNQLTKLPDNFPDKFKTSDSLEGNLLKDMPNQKQLVLKNSETINTKLGSKITLSKLESKVEVDWNGVRESLNVAYKIEAKLDENFIDSKLYTIDTGVTYIPLSIVGSDETNTFTTTPTPIEVTIANNKVIEDNWLNREVARQVGKDFKDLTDNDYLKISTINLSNTKIQEEIPKDIGKLKNLEYLYLTSCELSGAIPKEIGNLNKLIVLHLWNNNLNGTIPKEISKLSKLEFLSFYENNLTGEILSYLKNLTSLHTLDLGKNNFTGEVGSNLINLSKLRYLTLNYNNFTGILQSYFNNFTNLTTASFRNNQFIGIEDGFPEKFKTNGSLEGNLIEGVPNQKQLVITNPTSIQVEQGKKLTVPTTTLKNVYLEWNGVTEPLSSYYKTDYVFTDDTKFDSKLYAIEHGTTELKSRIVGTNYTSSNSIDVEVTKKYVALKATATPSTKDWTNEDVIITVNTTGSEDIEYIEMVGGPQVQNTKTAEFAITQNGTYEFIAKSVIGEEKSITVKVTNIDKDKPVAAITQKENVLKATITLTLSVTENGSGIKEIILPDGKTSTSKSVSYEVPWDGDYTFTIIDKAGNVTVVTETVGGIQYDELWLAKEVARQVKKSNIQDLTLEDFESITTINLANKRIVGQIPDYIGVMTNLTTLKLNGNDLRNRIPDSIGDLDNLKTLNLSDNRFTGTIPSTIGDMESLENLDLGLNFFSGEIPSSLGNLQYIKTIYLCENRLTGEIPESLGELETLRNLCLDYNQLIGQVPKSVSALAATKDFKYNFLENEVKQNTISIKSKASITLNLNEEITHSAIKNSVNIITSINKTDVLDNPYSYTLEFEDDSFIENGVPVKTGTTKAKVKINYKDIDNSTVTSTTSIDVTIK